MQSLILIESDVLFLRENWTYVTEYIVLIEAGVLRKWCIKIRIVLTMEFSSVVVGMEEWFRNDSPTEWLDINYFTYQWEDVLL